MRKGKRLADVAAEDVESFLRGEEPSKDTLELAPRIDDWELLVDIDVVLEATTLVISGFAFACPEVQDGDAIETSALVWLDRKFRFARTSSVLYRLGDRVIPGDGVTL